MLTARELDDLHARGQRRRLPAGGTFCCEGERPGEVAYLLRGHVKLTRRNPAGDERVVAVRGPNTLVGEVAAIDELPREVTVTALDTVDAIVVEVAEFRRYLAARPRFALRLLEVLAARTRQSERERALAEGRPTLERVAVRLLELTDGGGRVGPAGTPLVPLQQRELASWAGASRESTNRALAILRRRGLVATGRGHVEVLDVRGLRRVIEPTP